MKSPRLVHKRFGLGFRINIEEVTKDECYNGSHPKEFTYRRYRRGRGRCKVCGGNISFLELIEKKIQP